MTLKNLSYSLILFVGIFALTVMLENYIPGTGIQVGRCYETEKYKVRLGKSDEK